MMGLDASYSACRVGSHEEGQDMNAPIMSWTQANMLTQD